MSDLLLDSNSDLQLTNGDLSLCTFSTEITQLLRRRLKFFYSEWFLDQSLGVPYFESILTKNPNPAMVDGLFKRAIIETPGILELTVFNLSFEPATRQFGISFQAKSIAGLLSFNEAIP